jgi:NOL1/NOP2/fmu family ribosome biogenesis protein
VRLFPHRLTGEGHFACLLKRDLVEEPERLRASAKDRQKSVELPGTPELRLWKAFEEEVLNIHLPNERLRQRGERLYFTPDTLPWLGGLRVPHIGVWLGTLRKDRFEPAHPLALFLRPGQARNSVDLSSHEAGSSAPLARYMRGETLQAAGPAGWTLLTVDGWPLGWGKRVQEVVKNHFPRGWQVY